MPLIRHALEGEARDWPAELREAREKVIRATDHLSTFKAEYDAFAGSEPYRVTADFEPEAGCYIARLHVVREPLRLSVIIGDIAHNLRSALDFIAWQLALAHVGRRKAERNRRDISFPIVRTDEDFRSHATVAFFSDDAKAVLERFQPYHRWNPPEPDLLFQLREISNTDKHRALHASFTALNLKTVTFRPRAIAVEQAAGPLEVKRLAKHGDTLEDGTPIAEIRFPHVADPQTTKVDVTGHPTGRDCSGSGASAPTRWSP
jgi:hypothetical protein